MTARTSLPPPDGISTRIVGSQCSFSIRMNFSFSPIHRTHSKILWGRELDRVFYAYIRTDSFGPVKFCGGSLLCLQTANSIGLLGLP